MMIMVMIAARYTSVCKGAWAWLGNLMTLLAECETQHHGTRKRQRKPKQRQPENTKKQTSEQPKSRSRVLTSFSQHVAVVTGRALGVGVGL
ncbi:Hypothetical predicted protein [Drosophila guanche]|uniref:Secreted protein n=1 Tax=Drosophila guanche TaxID=7266 RepID=A0A3B0J718_DROGU|nr:Hypothetical predicted protein [Drosophila guanche]